MKRIGLCFALLLVLAGLTAQVTNPSGGGVAAPATTFNISSNGVALVAGGSVVTLTSNYTNATTSLSDVTGLAFAVAANKNYFVTCDVTFSVDTNTATPNWAFTGPASPTTVAVTSMQGNTVSATIAGAVIAFASATNNGALTTITTNFPGRIVLRLQNGPNAGTAQLQAKANGVGIATLLAGSMCFIQQQ